VSEPELAVPLYCTEQDLQEIFVALMELSKNPLIDVGHRARIEGVIKSVEEKLAEIRQG